MIKIIAAVSSNGIIGADGKIPWKCKEDMEHFRKMTIGSTVIMGRKTYEECGKLKDRNNIVLSSKKIKGIQTYDSLKEAISPYAVPSGDIWLCGGAKIYEDGMLFADEILLTIIPILISGKGKNTYFPWINPDWFKISSIQDLAYGVQIKPFRSDNLFDIRIAKYIRNRDH